MSANHILITEVTSVQGAVEELASNWAALLKPEQVLQREIYVAQDSSTVLEILALQDLQSVTILQTFWQNSWNSLRQHLASDFSREVLELVEAPKNCSESIPTTPYLQLRHVEVLPSAYNDYRAWRERTIFDVVRNASEVEVFLAYHSLISSEPGVMFLSGFSGEVDKYTNVFTSDRYQQIVRDAGTQFITGGEKGLYTKIYRRVSS